MTDRVVELFCVRHAETNWNAEGRIQGCEDTILSERGRLQADSLAARLCQESFDVCYSSDLQRSLQTAHAINHFHRKHIHTDERLRERHFGVFQGSTLTEVEQEQFDLYQQFSQRSPEFVIPEGQSWRQKFEQVAEFMDDMLEWHVGQRILVLTHGGCLYCMAHAVLGIPLDRVVPMRCDNTSICVFAFETGRWILRRWGDRQHLESSR
jgi:probable phosphoglycerate mutase